MEVARYTPASWFDEQGALKKLYEIQRKGIPNMLYWRFMTLTYAGRTPGGEKQAFAAMRKRFKKFIKIVRSRYGDKIRWARKLEFHEDGWPHFHLLLEIKHKLEQEEMDWIESAWRLGAVDFQMVGAAKYGQGNLENGLRYMLKYAFKAQGIPEWFGEYYKPAQKRIVRQADGTELEIVTKPESFARIRFWQTSINFYTGPKSPKKKPGEPRKSFIPVRASVVINRQTNSIVLRALNMGGGIVASKRFDCPIAVWYHLSALETLQGNAALLGDNIETSAETIYRAIVEIADIEERQRKWLLKQIVKVQKAGHHPHPKAHQRMAEARRWWESTFPKFSRERAYSWADS
jgi:hypothetical protein